MFDCVRVCVCVCVVTDQVPVLGEAPLNQNNNKNEWVVEVETEVETELETEVETGQPPGWAAPRGRCCAETGRAERQAVQRDRQGREREASRDSRCVREEGVWLPFQV